MLVVLAVLHFGRSVHDGFRHISLQQTKFLVGIRRRRLDNPQCTDKRPRHS